MLVHLFYITEGCSLGKDGNKLTYYILWKKSPSKFDGFWEFFMFIGQSGQSGWSGRSDQVIHASSPIFPGSSPPQAIFDPIIREPIFLLWLLDLTSDHNKL